MTPIVYVLAYERPELLACALAGVCGYNPGYPVRVVDDCSRDTRVASILSAYAPMLESVIRLPQRGGIHRSRRTMFETFIASTQYDQLVQVESDMLIQPGAIQMLLNAYEVIWRHETARAGILNTHVHHWCHKIHEVREIEGYRVAYGHSGSEPFWTADRKTIANNLDALPATRPDLVLFLKRLGCASLYWPEIQSQHIGAGPPSIYYPTFAWHMVVYHNDQERLKDAGPLRQPYPFHSIQFPDFVNRYPASAVECYRALREHCPVALPELAGVI